MITDRLRWSILEANTDEVLSRDLNVMEPEVMINLSGPSRMTFKIPRGEQFKSALGINWKNWGQVVVCEIEIDYIQKIFAVGIVTENKIDPESGTLMIETTGFMGYPKGIPWLENFNPIAVDPFEVIQRIWAHVQGFAHANLNVEVTPALSGTQMLPGYGFDGSILSFDFFAMFIRAVDFPDCGDIINGLSRDIPFDMFEEAQWDISRTEVTRQIRMAYPFGGLQQVNLVFRWGENIVTAELADETDIQPVSDIIIRSWAPGRVYTSALTNADTTRYRRTIMEEDAKIDSTERAAAWAKRKLTRRNVPKHFSKIVINPNHPHAPYGSFTVGDSIYVEAPEYPWVGDIAEWHRITSIHFKEMDGLMELGLKVEGAFNYDPIEYNPDFEEQPTEDLNRIANGYFQNDLAGWTSLQGQWFRVATVTYDPLLNPNAGSVRVDCDDLGERFISHRVHCTPGEHLKLQAAVRWQDVESLSVTDAFLLIAFTSYNATPIDAFIVDQFTDPQGAHGWELLQMSDWVVPVGVNEVALQFTVTSGVSAGITWWTYARVAPAGSTP